MEYQHSRWQYNSLYHKVGSLDLKKKKNAYVDLCLLQSACQQSQLIFCCDQYKQVMGTRSMSSCSSGTIYFPAIYMSTYALTTRCPCYVHFPLGLDICTTPHSNLNISFALSEGLLSKIHALMRDSKCVLKCSLRFGHGQESLSCLQSFPRKSFQWLQLLNATRASWKGFTTQP